MTRIPNRYHFIFGLRPDFGGRPFSFIHYLAIRTCYEVNRPDKMTLYCAHEPQGNWWERAKPYVECLLVQPPYEIYGNAIEHYAHQADVLRLQILLELGGVYLDMDVVSLRPFAPLMNDDVVLGQEYGVGLCNAVILARPGAPFIREWLDTYRSFQGERWNRHSVRMPRELAQRYPHLVHVVDHHAFFWPMYWREHTREFFLTPGGTFCEASYCVHLWENANWPVVGRMTPLHAWLVESECSSLVCESLGREMDLRDVDNWYPDVHSDLLAIMERIGIQRLIERPPSAARVIELLRRAISGLQTPDREIFELAFVYGLSSDEIATLTCGTVLPAMGELSKGWQEVVSRFVEQCEKASALDEESLAVHRGLQA